MWKRKTPSSPCTTDFQPFATVARQTSHSPNLDGQDVRRTAESRRIGYPSYRRIGYPSYKRISAATDSVLLRNLHHPDSRSKSSARLSPALPFPARTSSSWLSEMSARTSLHGFPLSHNHAAAMVRHAQAQTPLPVATPLCRTPTTAGRTSRAVEAMLPQAPPWPVSTSCRS